MTVVIEIPPSGPLEIISSLVEVEVVPPPIVKVEIHATGTGGGGGSGVAIVSPDPPDPAGLLEGTFWVDEDSTAVFAEDAKILTVSDVSLIPPGTPAGTVIVITPGAPSNLPPIASFTTSISQLLVTVDASASSDPEGGTAALVYTWDFGDGSKAAGGKTTTHTYSLSGTYLISLSVKDSGGAMTRTTHSVTVNGNPGGGGNYRPFVVGSGVASFVASSNTHPIAYPSDIQNGDVLLTFMHGQSAAATADMTPPAGWSRIGPEFFPAASYRYHGIFIHTVTDITSEPTSVTFTHHTSINTTRKVGQMIAVRNVRPGDPLSTFTQYTAATNGTALTTDNATVGESNALALLQFGATTSAASTVFVSGVSSGWTQVGYGVGPVVDGSAAADWQYIDSHIADVGTYTMTATITGPVASASAEATLVLRGRL
jgi:PKD repeat protein